MIPGIAANPYQGRPTSPRHLFRARQDGWILHPKDHSTLWIDEARTQQATLPGDPVWWIGDKSPNQNHFGAPSSAARGRLLRWPASAALAGYPRNILAHTENLLEANVGTAGAGVLSETEFSVQAGNNRGIYILVPAVAGQTMTFSQDVKLGTLNDFRWAVYNNTASSWIVQNALPPKPVTSAEYTRISVTITVPVGCTGVRFYMYRNNTTDGGTGYSNNRQLEINGVETAYQRVGSGIWDVTEEGYPDCWGIYGDGVTTQYVAERGIPMFVDGKMRAAAGVTNPSLTQSSNAIVLSNQESSSYENGYRTYIQQSDNSFRILCRREGSNTIVTAGSQLPPVSALLDYRIDAPSGEVSIQMNNNAPASSTGPAGSIASSNFSLYAFGGGSNYFNGIIWGSIMVAEDPDPDTWEIGARQWLSDNAMGGILAI